MPASEVLQDRTGSDANPALLCYVRKSKDLVDTLHREVFELEQAKRLGGPSEADMTDEITRTDEAATETLVEVDSTPEPTDKDRQADIQMPSLPSDVSEAPLIDLDNDVQAPEGKQTTKDEDSLMA